jgi:hypothetical protein
MLTFRLVRRLVLGWSIGLLTLIGPTRVSWGAPAADPIAAMPVLAPETYSGNARHIGYGISVAPFVSTPNPAPLVDAMGLDWVKLYTTSQLNDFPNQHVLYRVDVPKDPADYTSWEEGLPNLARELASRGVDAVEIGNEANLSFEWGGRVPDSRLFTDALCRGYRAFKTYAPDIVVVAGGLAPTITTPDRKAQTDLDFAQEMFNYGAAACFDAWGYHPYGFNSAPEADPRSHELVFRRTERMYRLLWNNGIRDKQIWITEFGWVRDPREDGMDCTRDPEFVDFLWMVKDRDTQAAYTARAFDFADRNWPWVGPMFLWNLNWNLVEPWALSPCNHMRRFAILDNAGNPLPAFWAVQSVPKRPPIEYRPRVRGLEQSMTLTMEAGCTGPARLGSFTVLNSGYPGHLDVSIQPANGPGRPLVWTSVDHAESGTIVEVYVDATGLGPGIHVVPINLQAMGSRRLSTDLVRGWLIVHTPTTPACVAKWNNGG